MLAVAVVFALDLDARLATQVPGYTRALQGLEESAAADRQLAGLLQLEPSAPSFNRAAADGAATEVGDAPALEDYGPAPDFAGIAGWLNGAPLDLASLRGRVVLIDFWTYSCVNCLRTLPYLRRWDDAYRAGGLTIVGVHTPEFAFERDAGNVRDAVADLGIRYPVALDPDYGTWNAWGNRYWPAKYLIDRAGHVRFAHFGEGDYDETEAAIRELLAEPGLPAPVSGEVADLTPNGPQTPESYLGYLRLGPMQGGEVQPDREAAYAFPDDLLPDSIAYGGRWTIEGERAVAGPGARLGLRFAGTAVHLVLGPPATGAGTVEVRLDGGPPRTIAIDGYRLYTLAETPSGGNGDGYHELDLRVSPGVAGYAFTFGALGG
ncbi:MAG: thioredoxin family protein [Thermoleophilia bacterium]